MEDHTMTSRKLKNNSGMTLIELMLACGVMALALSLLFGSLISMRVIGEVSEERTAAVTAASNVLEELRTKNLTQLMASELKLPYGPGVKRAVTVRIVDSNGSQVTLPSNMAVANLPNPLEVQALVIWEDQRGRVYSHSSSTKIPR